MKYYVVSRGDDVSNQIMDKFHHLATQLGMQLDQENPRTVISIGGDGTMLQAFHMFKHRLELTSFVGIHTGHLGFFADWMPEETETLVNLIATSHTSGQIRIVRYPLVEIEIHTEKGVETHLALNEFTIKRSEGSLVAQLNINDEVFEMFRGDGICISSPCGSTAYNKSLGGAVIHPSLEAIQVTEIASINNRVYRTIGSPLILPKHHYCDIIPKKGQQIMMTLDHLSRQFSDIVLIRSTVSAKKINFARYRRFPFWNRVRDAFIDQDQNGGR